MSTEKTNIQDFCAKAYAPFCSVNVSYDANGKKKSYTPKTGWLDWNHTQSTIQNNNDNALLINIRKRFIVLDADTSEAKNKIIELLTKYKIYNNDYVDNFVTKSISNVCLGKSEKLHFWLRKHNHELKKELDLYNCGLDLITDYICEARATEICDNFAAMPILPDALLNDLLENTPNKIKGREIEIKSIEKELTNNNLNESIDLSEALLIDALSLLNDWRARDYTCWNSIGLILHSINTDYFYIWDDFSKRCIDKYPKETKLKKLWNSFTSNCSNPLTIATILYWAKMDNEEAYNEFKQKYFIQKAKNETNNELMSLILNLNQFEVSKYYYQAHKEKYIFGGDVKNKKSGWWGFKPNNIIINFGSIPTGLLNNMSDYLQNKIIEQQTILSIKLLEIKENKKISQDEKQEESHKIKAFLDACKKAYMKLGSSSFINGCIDYLNQLYFNDNIDLLVDASHHLLAFNNGVYDYLADEFRPIKPTDYISKSCNYNYNIKSNGEIRQKINKLLDSIFDNEEVKEYFIGIHGLSLFTNKLESLYLLNGKGSNGKGLLTSIIHGALGDYYLQAESTFLTSKHEAGKANSTLANAKGCRYLSISEPEDTTLESTFNMGLIKTLTGRDIISTRALYKDNIQYVPQFAPFIQCNQIPKLNSVGNAEKRRFKIINFPFQFVDNPTKPNEKLINRELKDLISNEFYNEFMLMMIEKANYYKNKQLTIPNDVIQHTNEYLEDNNILLGWFSNYIIQTNNNKDYVKVTDLFNHYKQVTNESIDNKLFLKNLKTFDIDISLLKGIKIIRGIQLKMDEETETNPLDI